jgi:hypothetical protein
MNLRDVAEDLNQITHVTPEQVQRVANAAADDVAKAARTTKAFIDTLAADLQAASDRIQALEDAIAKFKLDPVKHAETAPTHSE